jgi:hypothetical protein
MALIGKFAKKLKSYKCTTKAMKTIPNFAKQKDI